MLYIYSVKVVKLGLLTVLLGLSRTSSPKKSTKSTQFLQLIWLTSSWDGTKKKKKNPKYNLNVWNIHVNVWQILIWFIRHLNPTTHGDYPQSMKDHVGHRLPKFTEAQKQKLKNSADFVGINYYTSLFALHDEEPDPSKPSWQSDSLIDWERT